MPYSDLVFSGGDFGEGKIAGRVSNDRVWMIANKDMRFHPCVKDVAADSDWPLFPEGIEFRRPVRQREIKQRAIIGTSCMNIMENAVTVP